MRPGDPADGKLDAAADGAFAGAQPGTLAGALSRLERGFTVSRAEGQLVLAEMASLKQELARDRADAVRYRWLREHSDGFALEEIEHRVGGMGTHVAVRDWYGDTVGEGEGLDEAIDAAMVRLVEQNMVTLADVVSGMSELDAQSEREIVQGIREEEPQHG